MNIIKSIPNPGGAYPPIQTWDGETPPDGYYEITADISQFFNGFIVPVIENGVVTNFTCNTESWNAWKTVSIEQVRATALERIDGKCSIAIASGIDYNGKHYNLTETKQGYINNAYLEVLGGATQVKLAADGEDVTWHTATQITELFHKATDWGKICIYYKGYLFAWVGAETNTAVLDTIDYGTSLPAAYATSLTTKLSEEGIDITKYTTALAGG